MTTANEIVSDALTEIGVTSPGETLSAAEAADGLRALNRMLHAWQIDGIRLDHEDMALSDTFPYPPDHEEPVIYNLAVRLGRQHGLPLAADLMTLASQGKRTLRSVYTRPPKLSVPHFWNPHHEPNDTNRD